MKKIFIFLAACLFFSHAAIADDNVAIGTFDDAGKELRGHSSTASATTSLIGKTSTGVGLGMLTDVAGYSVVTQHKNGTKAYGSSYDSTAIYTTVEDVTVGTAYLDVPGATDTSDFSDDTEWRTL